MKYMYTLLATVLFVAFAVAQEIEIVSEKIDYKNIVLKEIEGEKLLMSFDMVIPSGTLSPRQSFVVTPILKAEGGASYTYGYIQVNGSNRDKTLGRTLALRKAGGWDEWPAEGGMVGKKEEKVISFSQTIPYESWMDEAYLVRSERLMGCAKSSYMTTGDFEKKVEIGYRPPVIPAVTYIAPKPIVKERDESGKAYLDFRPGQSVIDPGFRNNPEELGKLMEIVYKTSKDKDLTLNELSISGYASPEGSAALNESLSYKRAHALMEYIQKMSGISKEKFEVKAFGEDWEGLRELIEESDIARKGDILSIIDNDETPDRKEQQLKNLGAVYREMLNDLFPSLRRVEYRIDYTVRDYSLTEARELLGSDPQKLNSYELYLLARLYEEGSNEFNNIIELTVKLYPNETEANINAAAVFINKGEYTKAKECLDRVKHLPEAGHNLYIYEEMQRQGLIR